MFFQFTSLFKQVRLITNLVVYVVRLENICGTQDINLKSQNFVVANRNPISRLSMNNTKL